MHTTPFATLLHAWFTLRISSDSCVAVIESSMWGCLQATCTHIHEHMHVSCARALVQRPALGQSFLTYWSVGPTLLQSSLTNHPNKRPRTAREALDPAV